MLHDLESIVISGTYSLSGCSAHHREALQLSLALSSTPEYIRQLCVDTPRSLDTIYYRGMVRCDLIREDELLYGAELHGEEEGELFLDIEMPLGLNPTYDSAALALAGVELACIMLQVSHEDCELASTLSREDGPRQLTRAQARGIVARLLQGMTLC